MKIVQHLLTQFANEIAERISRKAISVLQKLTDTLSGDDSELTNIWDEVCVQVQHDKSYYWDAYEELIRSVVLALIEDIPQHEAQALWLQTEQGWGWLYDNPDEKYIPVFLDDVVHHVTQKYLYVKASKWTNERIRSYIQRQHFS